MVHITGAVPRPGVYALPQGARVQDGIAAAGGFLAEAEKTDINLAAPLEDGREARHSLHRRRFDCRFPRRAWRWHPSGEELIDINTASAAELEGLPGIGPSLAQRIVDYREENGPFTRPKIL